MIDEHPGGPKQPFWNRSLTKRQTLIACFAVGWLAVYAMMFIGDNQSNHHFPGLTDLLSYGVVASVIGPLFAWMAKWKSAGVRRMLSKDAYDRE